jgi:hypothetical protein
MDWRDKPHDQSCLIERGWTPLLHSCPSVQVSDSTITNEDLTPKASASFELRNMNLTNGAQRWPGISDVKLDIVCPLYSDGFWPDCRTQVADIYSICLRRFWTDAEIPAHHILMFFSSHFVALVFQYHFAVTFLVFPLSAPFQPPSLDQSFDSTLACDMKPIAREIPIWDQSIDWFLIVGGSALSPWKDPDGLNFAL